ncbi:class I SAM-dependent methyltransferase [Alphaproteobacteria bacterium]|nr:class I SAM-dependent methyltransferase [Alphaproteobacteria bacterium]MDA9874322.1 class I SAM-dependent methyltransferase [Alphaproteobacteria bacterium]MDC6458356.1 class I SAM-dependent methyltransferase [Alphaproteobacteria bacterium]
MKQSLSNYQCPDCQADLYYNDLGKVSCRGADECSFDVKDDVIFFEKQKNNYNDYSISAAAEVHDNSLDWLLKTHNTTEDEFRQDILHLLKLEAGQKILVTGVGAGNDLPYICEAIGENGEIFAQDIAEPMLLAAVDRSQNKFKLQKYKINFSLSDAVKLPYKDETFDVVYHFGGINLYSDLKKGIEEMDRVTKNKGRVVFGDEGLADWLANTEIGKMLAVNNPLYSYKPPLSALPETARAVQLNWTINNCYYLISFNSFKAPLDINLDLKHKGKRGGTIRSRFYGVLEGIDPKLKEELYRQAEAQGLSRADFIERLLEGGLKEVKEK